MSPASEWPALQQAFAACQTHREALQEALDDLCRRALTAGELEHLGKEDRRLLDQFAYRYTRLQDDMGARLMPGMLGAVGEDTARMAMLDRLNRLEQLGWLPSADEWTELRRIRNEFAHDYPQTAAERFGHLQLAQTSARRLIEILTVLEKQIDERFPDGAKGRPSNAPH